MCLSLYIKVVLCTIVCEQFAPTSRGGAVLIIDMYARTTKLERLGHRLHASICEVLSWSRSRMHVRHHYLPHSCRILTLIQRRGLLGGSIQPEIAQPN